MKVPQYERRVNTIDMPVRGTTTQANPIALGGGVAQGLSAIGGVLEQDYKRAIVADSQNAMLQMDEYANQLFSDPKNGVITKQQRNALNVSETYLGSLDQKFNELKSNLTPGAATLFENQFKSFRTENKRKVGQYEYAQVKAYENSVAQGTLTNLSTNLSNAYGDNEATKHYATQIKQQLDFMGAANGWPDEYKKSMEHTYIYSAAYQNVENLVASNYVEASQIVGEPSIQTNGSQLPEGLLTPGNIDMSVRPQVKNKDGTVSTVRTISIGEDGKEILIPTVSEEGKILSEQEAIELYHNTGKHLGVFDSPSSATKFVKALHDKESIKVSARGERNNNPGNLISSSSNWVGQTGTDGKFATFATPEHGIRALSKNLLSYGNQGYDTVSSIIPRWSPDGNEQNYVSFISEKLGVNPDDKLDLNNAKVLASFTKAIVHFENGKNAYSDEQINRGVTAALGLGEIPLPEGVGGRITESVAFNTLNMSDQAKFLKAIEAQERIAQSQSKSDLELTIKDAKAAYLRGKDFPSPPAEHDFIRAYGYHDGTRNYAEFKKTQALGADIAAVQDMSASDLHTLVQQEPEVKEGYAGDVERFETLVKAVSEVNKQRINDPVAFAAQRGLVKDLDFTNNKTLQNSLSQRIAQAARISQDYQTPLQIFSKTEKEFMASMFEKLSAPEINDMLKTFRQTSGDDISSYNAILKQVGISHPSIAFAGGVLNTGKNINVKDAGGLWSGFSDPMFESPENISSTIILGHKSRKGADSMKGYQIPSGTNNDPKIYFNTYVGNAFAGSQQAYDETYQTALDYYVGESVKIGDFSKELDTDRWNKAMRAATGGVIDFNGSKTILPYGMDEIVFNDQIKKQYYNKVINTGIVKGKNSKKSLFHVYDPTYSSEVDVQDLSSILMPYQLERRKDGQYYIVNGTTYLYEGEDDNVKAIVLDVYEDN